jgi:hypothetical protein
LKATAIADAITTIANAITTKRICGSIRNTKTQAATSGSSVANRIDGRHPSQFTQIICDFSIAIDHRRFVGMIAVPGISNAGRVMMQLRPSTSDTTIDQAKEILSYEISDEALESAAGTKQVPNYTLFYCTALDLCPGP